MDRDEINVIHCTYWGRKVRESVLKVNKDPLISCGPDTAFRLPVQRADPQTGSQASCISRNLLRECLFSR